MEKAKKWLYKELYKFQTGVKEVVEEKYMDIKEENGIYSVTQKVIYEIVRKEDEALIASLKADNIDDVKRMKLRESIDKALLKNAEPPIELMNKLSKNKGLANLIVGELFHLLMRDLQEDVKE